MTSLHLGRYPAPQQAQGFTVHGDKPSSSDYAHGLLKGGFRRGRRGFALENEIPVLIPELLRKKPKVKRVVRSVLGHGLRGFSEQLPEGRLGNPTSPTNSVENLTPNDFMGIANISIVAIHI